MRYLSPLLDYSSHLIGPEMAAEILAPLKIQEYEATVIPVNNNPDVSQAYGGTHWC